MRRKIRSLKYWKWTTVGEVVILFCGLFLRLFKLNLIPVFADEAIYIRWAQVMRAETTLRFVPLSDGKQPLFMWSVMPALKFISDPLIAGRIVSVICGLGIIVGVFALSYILFKSRKAALLSSLLYALSPFAFFYDRMALVDSMLSFFGLWALILAILAVKNLRLDFSLLAGFALGGAMLTKSPAIFFIVLMPTLLLFIPTKKGKLKNNLVKATLLLLVTIGIGYGFYNILRLGPNFELIASRNYDYVYQFSHVIENPLDPLVGNLGRSINWYIVMGPSLIVLMALAGFLVNVFKYKKAALMLLFWSVVPILVESEYAKNLTARYIFFTLPIIIVLAASILKRFKKLPKLYIAYAAVLLFIVQSFLFYLPFFYSPATAHWSEREGYLANWTAGTGIKEVADIIKEKRAANPDRRIVVGTEGYFGTLPDGLQMYLEGVPGIQVVGVGLGIYEIPDKLKASVEFGSITYLVANSSRLNFKGSFEDNGLRVVAAFEKAPRDEGSHDYVANGPVDTFYLFEVTPDAIK